MNPQPPYTGESKIQYTGESKTSSYLGAVKFVLKNGMPSRRRTTASRAKHLLFKHLLGLYTSPEQAEVIKNTFSTVKFIPKRYTYDVLSSPFARWWTLVRELIKATDKKLGAADAVKTVLSG